MRYTNPRTHSLTPDRRAHSSKPAAAACVGRMGWTDRRTDGRTDARPFHRPCSAWAVPKTQFLLDVGEFFLSVLYDLRKNNALSPQPYPTFERTRVRPLITSLSRKNDSEQVLLFSFIQLARLLRIRRAM